MTVSDANFSSSASFELQADISDKLSTLGVGCFPRHTKNRKPDSKFRAITFGAVYFNGTLVELYEVLRRMKTDTSAGNAGRGAGPKKALEKLRDLFLRDANAFVLD